MSQTDNINFRECLSLETEETGRRLGRDAPSHPEASPAKTQLLDLPPRRAGVRSEVTCAGVALSVFLGPCGLLHLSVSLSAMRFPFALQILLSGFGVVS